MNIASIGAWIALGVGAVLTALAVTSNALFATAAQYGWPIALVTTHATLAIHNHANTQPRLWPSLLTLAALILTALSASVTFALAGNWANATPVTSGDGAAQMGIFFSALIMVIALVVSSVAALFASLAGRMTGRLGALPARISTATLLGWVLVLLGLIGQAPLAGVAGVALALLSALGWSVSIALHDWLDARFPTKQQAPA